MLCSILPLSTKLCQSDQYNSLYWIDMLNLPWNNSLCVCYSNVVSVSRCKNCSCGKNIYVVQATAFSVGLPLFQLGYLFSVVTAFSVGLPFFSWVTQFLVGFPLSSEKVTIFQSCPCLRYCTRTGCFFYVAHSKDLLLSAQFFIKYKSTIFKMFIL